MFWGSRRKTQHSRGYVSDAGHQEDALNRGRQFIRKDLNRRVKKGRISGGRAEVNPGRILYDVLVEDLAGVLPSSSRPWSRSGSEKFFADLEAWSDLTHGALPTPPRSRRR